MFEKKRRERVFLMIYVTKTTSFTPKQAKESDLIFVEIGHEEIERQTVSTIGRIMSVLEDIGSDAQAKLFLVFEGYDDRPEDVYLIPEIKAYTQLLLKIYPHIFFFLTHEDRNSSILYLCMMDSEDMLTAQDDVTKMSTTTFRINPDLVAKIVAGTSRYLLSIGRPANEAYTIVEKISGVRHR